MAKQELFKSLFARTVVVSYGAFPVRRGQLDRQAVRSALKTLQNGWVLGMFPEGKRSVDTQLQPAQAGASLIASRSRVPILPVGISGTEHIQGVMFILRRPRVIVTIGHPFSLPPVESKSTRSRLAHYSDIIMEHIAELLPQSYRGQDSARSSSRSGNGD